LKLPILLLVLVLAAPHAKKRKPRWNPVLQGSHGSMVRQNDEINRLQLPRIVDDNQLLELERTAELVPLSPSLSLSISSRLVAQHRNYCRPWTRQFLLDISAAYFVTFHKPLIVTSAVRTVEQQRVLTRTNHAAAPADGEITSSHLSGISVDISKRILTRKQHQWIENYLKGLRDQGLIEAAEEHSQQCFHVSVMNGYQNGR
jgi:hypothetical protein